jgi:hypothetical protein
MYSQTENPDPETEERHYWNILLINDNRDYGLILEKLRSQFTPTFPMEQVTLNPIRSERVIDKGKIRDSKLNYWLMNFETTVSRIDFSKVYQGKVKWDRRLAPRKTVEGWNDLIDKVYEGKI